VDTLGIVFISMFACCELFFFYDSTENDASMDVTILSEYFTYHLPHKEYLIILVKFCPVLCYQLISEHSGVNCMILLLTIAK